MTPEAAEHVRSHLRPPDAGEELALITVLRQGEVVRGRERTWIDGEHFMVCTYNIGQRPNAQQIELFGHQVSIVPSTLESLRGRTLAVRHVVVRRGWFSRVTRDVLVAAQRIVPADAGRPSRLFSVAFGPARLHSALGEISKCMRLFLSLAFLIGGIGLCLLDGLAHALANASALNLCQKELQSFPNKDTYTRAELGDAAWRLWTNRVSLPAQATYTVEDLKRAVVSPLLGTSQDSCDRVSFEYAIRRAAGCRERSDHGATVAGVLAMLIGTFLLGGALFPAQIKRSA